MPTGYTAPIEDGCSFPEYLWGCAKAFGACISMRDEPADTPIPDKFAASSYHQVALAKATKELARLQSLTENQIWEELVNERNVVMQSNIERVEENKLKNERYSIIRSEVEAWSPPTPDHVELKKFMLEQIETSLPLYEYQQELPPHNPKEWLAGKVEKVRRDIEYHTKGDAEERERNANRNNWIAALRSSVPQPSRDSN